MHILPWGMHEIEDFFEEEKPQVLPTINHTYDMNMRNYQAGSDIPIKSIKELRQQTD
jgi:hypothetical protein